MTRWKYTYEKLGHPQEHRQMIGVLDDLGNEGWELCAAFRVGKGTLSGIFKRKRE